MIINASESERRAILNTAYDMACAARTAPKTKGVDRLGTLILVDNDVQKLSEKMYEIGMRDNLPFFVRDSEAILRSTAVLLIAVNTEPSGLNEICQYCGAKNCEDAMHNHYACAFASIDLGIAVGSAVSVAADNRVDNRTMFSAGKAAMEEGYFHKKYNQIIAISLASSGKNPFYDRIEQFGPTKINKEE